MAASLPGIGIGEIRATVICFLNVSATRAAVRQLHRPTRTQELTSVNDEQDTERSRRSGQMLTGRGDMREPGANLAYCLVFTRATCTRSTKGNDAVAWTIRMHFNGAK